MSKPTPAETCPDCGKPLKYLGNIHDGYYYGCDRVRCKTRVFSSIKRTKLEALADYWCRR